MSKGISNQTAAVLVIAMVIVLAAAALFWRVGLNTGKAETVNTVKIGSAMITHVPNGILCFQDRSNYVPNSVDGEVIFNYTGVTSNMDLGRGYITVKADGGAINQITATAMSGNTTAVIVRQASPNENFMFSNYEEWPSPPNYIKEGDSVTFEYYLTLLSGVGGWGNNTQTNVTLAVQLPESGNPDGKPVGCDKDIGDGVCSWVRRISVRNLQYMTGNTTDSSALIGTFANQTNANTTANAYGNGNYPSANGWNSCMRNVTNLVLPVSPVA